MNTVKSFSKKFCSVPQCSTYASGDISLHYFPLNDKKLCEKWKYILKIGKPISQYMQVCSKHFVKEDYLPITNETKKKRLKKGVIPSQNLPIGSHEKKKSKERSWRVKQARREDMSTSDGITSNAAQQCLIPSTLVDTIPKQMQPGTKFLVPSLSTAAIPEPEQTQPVTKELYQNVVKQRNLVSVGTQTDFYDYNFSKILLGDDDKLKAFTNCDLETLDCLKECCDEVLQDNNKNLTNLQIKILLVLIKLKLNIPFLCLAILFNISAATCTRYFYTTLSLLAIGVKSAIYWPSKGEILANMPKCFSGFMNTRVVLDCTEIGVDKCKCLKCRIVTYSHYKGRHTIKFLIGITPSGLISYISKAHGGRASDKSIFNKEKLINKLDPYDAIMVDKGFLISNECEEKLITLIRPPFLKKQKQFSKADAEKTSAIARARIHVERAIQRLKTYRIVNDQIAWYFVHVIDDIMTVVAALVNLSPPILGDDKFMHEIVDECVTSPNIS